MTYNVKIFLTTTFLIASSQASDTSSAIQCHTKPRAECLQCCKLTTKINTLYSKYCTNDTKTLSNNELTTLKNEVAQASYEYKKVDPQVNTQFYSNLFNTKSCVDLKAYSNFDTNSRIECSQTCKDK